MRLLFWTLSILSLVGVWYSSEIHIYIKNHLAFYTLSNSSLIQVILAVLAGILATKASDSSRELKKLLKLKDIEQLIQKADYAADKSKEESFRLKNIVKLVKIEVEQQYAREMAINHRKQLQYHWEQILTLESVLDEDNLPKDIDHKISKIIQNYIIKTQYIEYMGKNFLRNVPIFGSLLNYLLGPIWNVYYMNNLSRFKRIIKTPKVDSQQDE